ncbi:MULTISPECIES: S8 family peptidase [Marinobacter]|uniref:Serine protease n=1 Tax=Marinobacter profundi TaxID=2666256 RepID=A0A2G1UIJ2_9GAMM|nr:MULTISPECIES: S8 family peptidase [Marinobacter]MBD3655195.1 S8 family peptidase [Marinobacter sp.]PHQ14297.1 serine protease [Marinobacter profundi]
MLTRMLSATCLSAALLAATPAQAGLFDGVLNDDTLASPEAVKVGDVVPGRYIVTLDPALPQLLGLADLRAGVNALLQAVGGGSIVHLYQSAMTGAAVSLSAQQAAMLSSLPGVRAIEPDQVVLASATQTGATWGLDRSDQTFLPLNEVYQYPDNAGSGANVYIIDTGLRSSHQEFSGRVIEGRNFAVNDTGLLGLGGLPLIGSLLNVGGETDPADTTDCNGHGTHVASTAVGTTYGVAKAASVAAVRVLDCSGAGSNADVIAGVDWVAANHRAPAVANMSLGGGDSEALDAAVRGAVAAGVTFVVAAGNSDADACNGSPNRVQEAITVGSTTREDERSSFSNFGSCLDIFAPGSDITAAWYQSDAEINTISGTSMASPHVAGAVALLLASYPGLTPDQVGRDLDALATVNVLSGINAGSPNLLLRVPR